MIQRFASLLVSMLLPLFLLNQLNNVSGLTIGPDQAAGMHDVIINEWSQGNGGYKEWVELLVVHGPLDMRGWDIGDDSPGDLVFSEDFRWSFVPTGTLIVIYNGSDRDGILPADDNEFGGCSVVISDEDAGLFNGRLPAFTNNNPTDSPQLRDSAGGIVHNLGTEPGGLSLGGQQTAAYASAAASGVGQIGNWGIIPAAAATPAAGNGGQNSAWTDSLCLQGKVGIANLSVAKTGPTAVRAGETFSYTISLGNYSTLTATAVRLTDTLPPEVHFTNDDGQFPVSHPDNTTVVWQVGDLPTKTISTIQLTVTAAVTASGRITNHITAATAATETTTADNVDSAVVLINSTSILVDALLYDGYESGELDEAVRLINAGSQEADISGWQISDGVQTAVIPGNLKLPAGETLWLAQDGAAFRRQFGFNPDLEKIDSSPFIQNLGGNWPGFANTGDELLLLNASGQLADVLVYEGGNTAQQGWSGTAVFHYPAGSLFGQAGQILYRRRDQQSGQPVPDTNSAGDWAQMTADIVNGRKVLYPGWDLDTFFFTRQVTESAVLTVAVAPDNAFEAIHQQLASASQSIHIETLTFESVAIGQDLALAAGRGVSVTVLMEGSPTGGLPDQEKYNCQQLEAAGGQCWFMITDDQQHIYDRYRYLHAKFILIDGKTIILSSENLSPNSLPDDDKKDGTWGRRGVVLMTDAPGVVSHVKTLFNHDFDPANHQDLQRWHYSDPVYGSPPGGFVPITVTGGITYQARFPQPAIFTGTFPFELVQSPENSLRDRDGLLGLVNQAGMGDEVMVEQLQERPYWGANPIDDPNPRLVAYINAARRGARVRILLDAFFDRGTEPLSNKAACAAVNGIAESEGLRLECALGNPAGLGIHNKMILAQINGRGFIHVGSINGTEQSSKGNRELALQVASDEAFSFLAGMFDLDWPQRVYLPVVTNAYIGPASHLLLSEALYDPPGWQDDAEFIEIVNPTGAVIDLSGYSLGDAVNRDDYEDVRRFPAGTSLAPQGVLVVATTAAAFEQDYGTLPDFEIIDSSPQVADLVDDPAWGDPGVFLKLGNSGDEVILRDGGDKVVDVLVYGAGSFPGVTACPLVTLAHASLERNPWWRDTDNCPADFREWPFPSPGTLP